MTTRKEPTPLRQQIDRYRKQRGMTTKQLYTEAGLSRASYYRKITGEQEFTLAELRSIARTLDCEMKILLTPNGD